MIAQDNLPLLIVENESFRQVMKTVTHLYTIPNRKSITKLLDVCENTKF